MNSSLSDFKSICENRLENIFNIYLKSHSKASCLQEAMHYSVSNGGKRVRPLLVYATGCMLGARWEDLDAPACAVEFIHAYSLIHDDLPAMDNSDLRRGKPSCHKKFDEAFAILAGDALQTMAFEILSSHPSSLSSAQRLQMIQILSLASGLNGMAGGQSLDIKGTHSLQELIQMYQLKTGALLSASVQLGAAAAGVSNADILKSLEKFSSHIGFAFQIQDDLLDHSNQSGKPLGLDELNNKKTYVYYQGHQDAADKVKELFSNALEAIEKIDKSSHILNELVMSLIQRNY